MVKAGLNPSLPHDPGRVLPAVPQRVRTTATPPSTFRTGATPGKIRLGFLSPNLNAGGAENVQLQLLKGLDPTKFTFVGMVVKDPMSATDANMTAATAAYVPIQYGLSAVAGLAANCDVIISWMVEDMAKWTNGSTTPFVFIDHFPHSGALDATSQYCLQGAAAVVGVSPLCSPAWQASSWKARYSVIANGIDTSRLAITQTRAQMLAKWGLPANALVAGSYCRIHLDRRPDAVIRALPLLPQPWHAVVIGEVTSADEQQYLTNLVSQMGPDDRARVHILPEDSNSGNVLNAFDVVVSAASGVTESFGLTMLEASCLNKPIVATPYGLAQMYPLYFYNVLLDDTPLNVATAILAAKLGGGKPGAQAFMQRTFSATNFITSWAKLLTGIAPTTAMPSLARMGANFAKAVVTHAANGFAVASPEVQASRMATCRACPDFKADTEQCRLCGCLCQLKKAFLSERCPKDKWGPGGPIEVAR